MTKVVTLSRSSPITIETDLVWRLIAPTARSVPTTITSTFLRTSSVADLRHLLCLGGGRRKNEDEGEHEPDQPHGHLVETAGGESSRTLRRAPAPTMAHRGGAVPSA
jgi:hypothetical protein